MSLRRISTEAGSKNSAAMHYHFHNKLGVVQALVDMIAGNCAHRDATATQSRARARCAKPAATPCARWCDCPPQALGSRRGAFYVSPGKR